MNNNNTIKSKLYNPKSLRFQAMVSKVKKGLGVIDDLADAALLINGKIKPKDIVSLGMKAIKVAFDLGDFDSSSCFDDHSWVDVNIWGFRWDIIDICNRFVVEKIKTNETTIFIADLSGEKVGWIIPDNREYVWGPYIPRENYDRTILSLGKTIWEHCNSSTIELRAKDSNKANYSRGISDACTMLGHNSSIESEKVYESTTAKDILKRIKKFKEKGFSRSIMLIGQPGTGKTSIMKYLSSEIGGFVLRVKVSEIKNINPRDIVNAVKLLRPRILLIDDFDRTVGYNSNILTEIEDVNKSCDLFMVTVNDISKIDSALLRPGRFDEIIYVSEIDENIVEKIMGDNIKEEIKEKIKKWPVAYINEFNKRKIVLGEKEALEEVQELKNRIDNIKNMKPTIMLGEDDEDFDEEDLNEMIDADDVEVMVVNNRLVDANTGDKIEIVDVTTDKNMGD